MNDPWETTAGSDGRMHCRGVAFGPTFAGPLGPLDCETFIKFVCNRTGLDPRQQSDDWLWRTAEAWVLNKLEG